MTIKALIYKSANAQKRQHCMNFCCLTIFPAISMILPGYLLNMLSTVDVQIDHHCHKEADLSDCITYFMPFYPNRQNISVNQQFKPSKWTEHMRIHILNHDDAQKWGSFNPFIVKNTNNESLFQNTQNSPKNGIFGAMPPTFSCDGSMCMTDMETIQYSSKNAILHDFKQIILNGQKIIKEANESMHVAPNNPVTHAMYIEKSDIIQATIQHGDLIGAIYGEKTVPRPYSLINRITNGLLHQSSDYFINGALRDMPSTTYTTSALFLQIIQAFVVILIPVIFTMLLPMLSFEHVKNRPVIQLLMANGVNSTKYQFATFLHFYVLYLLEASIMLIITIFFDFPFKNHPFILIFAFLVNGIQIVALALFLSPFFKTPRMSFIFGTLLVFVQLVIGFSKSAFQDILDQWGIINMYGPLSFSNALDDLTNNNGNQTLKYCLSSLAGSILLLFLGWLIENRKDQSTHKTKKIKKSKDQIQDMRDQDVIQMQNKIENGTIKDAALIVQNISKSFGATQIIDNCSFYVESNTVFGLLGANGAGKSTLIHILTGFLKADQGTAKYGKLDLHTHKSKIRQNIGICLQHDLFIPHLTVLEHLICFGLIKGYSLKQCREMAKSQINQSQLNGFENRFPDTMSGGEKRRLSISMANINHPKIIYLDEPTTGLDPQVRRVIWNMIHQMKSNSTVILTTHNLEEVEILCQQISIFVHGQFKCIGTLQRLKQLYGTGYHITLSINKSKLPQIKKVLHKLFKNPKITHSENMLECQVKYKQGYLVKWFKQLEHVKHQNIGIYDFNISQCSLEDVFLKLVGQNEI
eukprot:NODE_47_length_32105_cov_1.240892.p1 type:complete len:808 gc:universal NODE_47_length_32105_cov_1.240892:9509-11932(+)